MAKLKVGEEEPKIPEEGETPKTDLPGEKTSEEKIKSLEAQVGSLQAQKEHFREKAQELGTELEELKIKPATPSEEELAKQIPDWDMLSPTEQQLHKEIAGFKKELTSISKQFAKKSDQAKKEEKLAGLLRKYPELQEQEMEFREFCGDEEPSEHLVKSFLFEKAEEIGARKEAEKKEREGLEKGTGGEKTPPAPGMSLADIERLRKSNPKEYQRLLREKRIKIPEE